MATHLVSIARPYAQAAFQYAKEKSDLEAWKVFLDNAASTVNDPQMAALIASEALTKEQLSDILHATLGASLDSARTNFLRLLLQNKRAVIFPLIASLFDILLAALMKKANVRLVTASTPSDVFKTNLATHLSRKLGLEIELHCEKDPSILGGAVVYINNKVIDGSIRGKLNRLLEFTLR